MIGLLQRPEWLDRILHHGKVWDIRAHKTSKVGQRIALVECGVHPWVVRGHATLAACMPIDTATLEQHEHLHQAPGWSERYTTPHAWVLSDVQECDPVAIRKRKGCVVWTQCTPEES